MRDSVFRTTSPRVRTTRRRHGSRCPGTSSSPDDICLRRRLGRGAMGQVYLASDTKFASRNVAVKTVRQDILNSDDLQEGEAIARFEREAQAAASIQHPNTVSVTDFGESEDGVFYLVMEYVEGETLHKLLRREGTLPVKRAVRLLRQIADGVDAAHDLGILHRDLKPANIFIMQKGKRRRLYQGRRLRPGKDRQRRPSPTTTRTRRRRRAALSARRNSCRPNRCSRRSASMSRADLYALGTIAYLMLGGKTPFTGDMMQLVMQKIMHKPPPLSSLRSDIPARCRARDHAIARDRPGEPSCDGGGLDRRTRRGVRRCRGRQTVRASRGLWCWHRSGAEVYVNDERKGSVGSSGRVVLSDVPPGQHILRVSKAGEKDDERVIEIREGADEQVIQAQLKPLRPHGSQPSPSQGSSSSGVHSSLMPGIVACTNCSSRFAEGVKFCGRCGGRSFTLVTPGETANTFPCPRCSSPLPENSRFCGRCGLNMAPRTSPTPISASSSLPPQAERICRRCGGSYPPNIRFCGRCGQSMT